MDAGEQDIHMKQKYSILVHMMIPLTLILLLIPLLCGISFWHFSEESVRYAANSQLEKIHEPMCSLIDTYFSDTVKAMGKEARKEEIRAFITEAQDLIQQSGTGAELVIYRENGKAVYPRGEKRQARIQTLIDGFQEEYKKQVALDTVFDVQVHTDTGTYLVDFYNIPGNLPQITYVAVGYELSGVATEIRSMMRWIMLIVCAIIPLCLIFVFLIVRAISVSLQQMSDYATSIGRGERSELQSPYAMRELEVLRLEMNGLTKQIKHANDIQKDFLQNVSHELRNPLMSISGYAQGIEHGIFKKPEVAAHTILEESGRLTELVTSLLTLSRIESRTEEQNAKLTALPIDEVLEDCLDRVSGVALERGIQMEVFPYDEAIAVLGDGEMICKVLENFLTNALRYAKSQVCIRVSIDSQNTLISVEDDGEGIAAKDLPHLFERCYKGKGGNYGIGLAIARSAAESMQGTVQAANLPEGGAVFTLTLRRAI